MDVDDVPPYTESSDKRSLDGSGCNETESSGITDRTSLEGKKETPSSDNDTFKAPSDITFKKPIFTKLPKKGAKSEPGGKTDELQEEKISVEEPVEQNKPFAKSPAQQLVEKSVPLPYKEPPWSGLPKHEYSFEVLKNGIIVETIPLNKPYLVIGRLAQCDVVLEHPSLSRFHCIIQYRAEGSEEHPEGFYAYDLASTHGSFHNKHRMKPRTYYRLHVGHMVKFGGSSRMLILQGPDEDQEPESELTVTELKAEAAKRAEKLHRLETGEIEEEDRDRSQQEKDSQNKGNEESEGIDWGMGEDAVEDEDEDGEGGENPFASLNEELYLNDPKKTLRGWFEREGYDLPEYVAEDISPGQYRCKVELPIPGPGGGPLVAIAEHRGKKKAAVIQCALEACRLLDRRGLLRQAQHESHEKKRKDWAQNDYYDSDEDDFLDRTGDVQRKRLRRMKTVGGKDSVAETYESLIAKYNEVTDELSSLEEKLAEAERLKEGPGKTCGDEDDLDSFMKNLKSQVPDKHKRVNWKLRTVELRKEEMRLRRLANVARPFNKPELQPYSSIYDVKLKSPAKSPFQKKADSSTDDGKGPKSRGFKVHKAFMEEEPEEKIKLRRLDDDYGDELKPVKYSSSKLKQYPKLAAPERKHNEKDLIVRDSLESSKNKEKEAGCSGREDKLQETSTSETVIVNSNTTRNLKETNNGDSGIYLNNSSEDCDTFTKKPRFVGPTLPPTLEGFKGASQDPSKSKKKPVKQSSSQADALANYDTWVPPSNQSGDGRTSLNDKYGY